MIQIEIDLTKLERGLREGRVKVTRGGKTFYRKQRVGVKEKIVDPKIAKMAKINICDKLSNIFGEEIVDDYRNRISGMSKEELYIESENIREIESVHGGRYSYQYLTGYTDYRKLIDGYITQKLDLGPENSRMYKKDAETSFMEDPVDSPFAVEETLMKSILLNQALLRIDYPDGIIPLYRGSSSSGYEKTEGMNIGDSTDIRTYNLSSWTQYFKVADGYASTGHGGLVVKTEIPIENVLWSTRLEGATAGRGDVEDKDGFEYVVMHGGNQKSTIISRKIYEKPLMLNDIMDWLIKNREEEQNG